MTSIHSSGIHVRRGLAGRRVPGTDAAARPRRHAATGSPAMRQEVVFYPSCHRWGLEAVATTVSVVTESFDPGSPGHRGGWLRYDRGWYVSQ
jgi:hypothetical protein